jgi:hypothetical protein
MTIVGADPALLFLLFVPLTFFMYIGIYLLPSFLLGIPVGQDGRTVGEGFMSCLGCGVPNV